MTYFLRKFQRRLIRQYSHSKKLRFRFSRQLFFSRRLYQSIQTLPDVPLKQKKRRGRGCDIKTFAGHHRPASERERPFSQNSAGRVGIHGSYCYYGVPKSPRKSSPCSACPLLASFNSPDGRCATRIRRYQATAENIPANGKLRKVMVNPMCTFARRTPYLSLGS